MGSCISGCLPDGAITQIVPKARKINGLRAFLFPFHINEIQRASPVVQIDAEVSVIYAQQIERFAKTQSELDILFRQFCLHHVGGYAKTDSTLVLEMALKLFF